MTEPKAQYDELYKSMDFYYSQSFWLGIQVLERLVFDQINQKCYKKQSQPTIGVEYAAQSILLADVDKIVKSVIWDTAGAEKYKAITTAHYRKSEGALLFYDLCDKTSFDNVLSWRQEIIQHTDDKIMIMLIGNKLDLLQDNPQNRCVSVEEVEQICQQHNMLYNETSAKEGTNVKECFEQLIRKIYEFKQQNVEEEFPSQRIEIEDEKSEKKTQEQPQPNVLTVPTKQNRNPSDNCCGST